MSQALHTSLGHQQYLSSALSKNFQHQDAQRKVFIKLFNQIIFYLGNTDKNLQSQGLSALQTMASSHFVLFLQEKAQLQKLFTMWKPQTQPNPSSSEGETQTPIYIKVLECVTNLCSQQVHFTFRSAVLNSRYIYNKALKQLLEALELKPKEEALSYLHLFLAVCAGPEPGPPTKGQARARPRRTVYIPGETQE